MKKLLCFFLIVLFTVFSFTSCKKNKSEDKDNSQNTTVFTTGKEVGTSVAENSGEKQVAHVDEQNSVIKMDHFGDNNKIIYSEVPVYDSSGNVTAYKYIAPGNKLIGTYNIKKNEFYNSENKKISEDEFVKILEKYGR